MTLLTARLEASESARLALTSRLEAVHTGQDASAEGVLQYGNTEAEGIAAPAPPHLLWERVQELTASEAGWRERAHGLEGMLEFAQARCRAMEAEAREGSEERRVMSTRLSQLESEAQVCSNPSGKLLWGQVKRFGKWQLVCTSSMLIRPVTPSSPCHTLLSLSLRSGSPGAMHCAP